MGVANQKVITDRTVALLNQMDGLFGGFFEWMKGQYDDESGGFFYARSSRSLNQLPDIESSSQALNILERVGLLEGWEAAKKEKAIRFFQNKQDSASGYFYEENPDMRDDDVMVGRALSYSVGAIRKLGGAPLYPLPEKMNSMPVYMKSPDAYEAWLNAMPLTNSWRGCDRLCNSAPYIGQLPEEKQKEYLKRAFDFFARIQDPETGLWGQGSGYVRISGSFKLETFYSRFHMPMPRGEVMYRSMLRILREETARDMCYIRNPINLLGYMRPEIPPEEYEEILGITIRNMGRLLQADGGFSRELGHSPVATNVAQVKEGEFYPEMPKAVPLGLGLAEGDMNAGTQALLIRSFCYDMAGLVPPQLDTSAFQ
jgi:hypothetical protein